MSLDVLNIMRAKLSRLAMAALLLVVSVSGDVLAFTSLQTESFTATASVGSATPEPGDLDINHQALQGVNFVRPVAIIQGEVGGVLGFLYAYSFI